MRNGVVLSAVLVAFGSSLARAQAAPPQGLEPNAAAAPSASVAAPSAPKPSAPQLKIEADNGTSIRFGFLTQLQYEAAGRFQDDEVSQNVFMRRMMLMIGGTVLRDFEYFIDTDFADMLKAQGDQSLKNGPGFSL